MVDKTSPHPVAQSESNDIRVHDDYERRVQVTENVNAGRRLAVGRIANLVWLLFGILEALIGLRVVLKLIAANPANPFANLVYSLTSLFLWPFQGLTVTPSAEGMVFEISSIIAMFVFALVGWIVVRLIWLLFYHPSVRRVRTIESEHEHAPE